MKRLMLQSVFGGLALAAACSTADARERTYAATLAVNDTAGVGVVGDGKLSLAEAIRLANGGLTLDALSSEERAQIKGRPGSSSADRILLTLGKGAQIILPAQPGLPPLTPASYMNPSAVELRSSLPPPRRQRWRPA